MPDLLALSQQRARRALHSPRAARARRAGSALERLDVAARVLLECGALVVDRRPWRPVEQPWRVDHTAEAEVAEALDVVERRGGVERDDGAVGAAAFG